MMSEEQHWRMKMVGITQEQWDWINAADHDPKCPAELPPFREWFTEYARIKNKRGEMIAPSLNEDQLKFVEVAEWCLENERPIRILWVSQPQMGRTTLTLAFMYWMAKRNRIYGISMGNYSQRDQTKIILYRLDGALNNGDPLIIGTGSRFDVMPISSMELRSETVNALHINLNGQNMKNGVYDLKLLMNVPTEGSCVVIEGRSEDRNISFMEGLWENAIPFEDFKKDRGWRNGYVKIFSPD